MLFKTLFLFILILINGLFSAAEMAFVSLNKAELIEDVQKKKKSALNTQKLMDNSSDMLAVIQICITVVGFLSSAFASETFAEYIVELIIPYVSISADTLESIIIVIVTLILSYFTLVLGELVPKKLALAHPQKVAYFTSGIISVLKKVFYPFVRLLSASTNLVNKILHIKDTNEDKLTEREIISVISKGRSEGIIDYNEEKLLLKVFKFDDTTARKVMTVREKVVAIDTYTSEKALLNIIRNCRYSRIPVYKDKMDNIVGIVLVKELLLQYSVNGKLDYKSIMHPVMFVQADEKIDDVFRKMQEEKQPMVIVKDENKVVGIITFNDAIEEIVGNLTDEYSYQ
ncbi:MAG: hemolysin family protein [Clostridia bacterium]